jgi:hypothetical protein
MSEIQTPLIFLFVWNSNSTFTIYDPEPQNENDTQKGLIGLHVSVIPFFFLLTPVVENFRCGQNSLLKQRRAGLT